ncbi:GntR family transcriptional regulator [Rhizobium multihospitium]|uniref:DNA-binding transcriptional regulator, GntR family n=1 Tax=Rhizobium multihospitium TaxID=410764 RepID=A0A1C3VXA2_9HYPH|nr:GntR family transcriptional regulator [Rhizobium multihospitium]SCB32298.1 DNA-binding transcriptional regulator, GntR family [Rhizobium multihospitium]
MENILQQTNLRDQALQVLKLRLISGDLVPGQIYSAAALAAELGVSNSPVREAMLTLVNQGLMETVKNRGFRVVPLSEKERRNIYELRMLLEIPSMVKLSAMKDIVTVRSAELSEFATRMVAYAKDGDIVGYLDMDRQFHLRLLELLENEQLLSIVENLRDQSRQYGLKALSERGGLVRSAEEHQPILDAIVSGNGPLTAELMTRHLGHLVGDWA